MNASIKRLTLFTFGLIILFTSTAFAAKNTITINIPTRTILFESKDIKKLYPVAVGKKLTNTPTGSYSIISKIVNPTWFPPWDESPVSSGPHNPLGYRWIGFYSDYGIHGNNDPASIGTLASAGCVRMFEKDAEELFKVVEYKDAVNVLYQTNFIRYSPSFGKVLFVYPDVYEKGLNTKSTIIKLLDENDINISKERFDKLYENINKDVVAFSQGYVLIDNFELISNDIYKSDDGSLNINLDDIKTYLGLGDEMLKDIKPIKKDSKEYISIDDVSNITGIKFLIDEKTDIVKMIGNIFKLNGKFIFTSDYVDYQDRKFLIPVRNLAYVLNKNVEWDEKNSKVLVDGDAVQVSLRGNRSYLSEEELFKLYGLKVDVDSANKIINIIRP